jgi:hypothetical protein
VLFLLYIIVTFLFHEVTLSLGYNMANSKDNDGKKKAVDKSPVHATVIPTKKSESVIGKEELRGALHTMKQVPNYQNVPIKSESQNGADKIEETKEITAIRQSLEGKTLKKQDETTAESTLKSQDKETETLEVRSTMHVGNETGKQGPDVQDLGAGMKDSNLDRVELPSNMDYVYPFTFAMAIWQDFALSAMNTYKEFARELSRLHSNWMNILLNVWQSSNPEKKRTEDE